MRLMKLEELTGEEKLARSIMTDDYKELLSQGSTVKLEYIPKLKDIGITEVYVQDKIADPEALAILKEDVNKNCKEKVQSIISKHTYKHSNDMIEIGKTADNIITNIMEEEEVIEQIFDIKERSADLYEHSISTCTLATLIALRMNLSKEMVHDISVGCLLHELGLRYLVINIDNINLEELSDRDLAEYKKHPLYGYEAVKSVEWMTKVSKEILLCHHEKIDGSGYPLHATEISLPTKIASVCDFFDEHICGIGCKRMKVYEVIEILKNSKGVSFDAEVVDTLLDFIAVYPSGSSVVTNEGEHAIVIKQNKGFPERPILQIISDKDGNPYKEVVIKDLLEHNSVFIDNVLN